MVPAGGCARRFRGSLHPRSFLAAATRLQILFPASVGSARASGARSTHGCILVAATRLFPGRNRSGVATQFHQLPSNYLSSWGTERT